MRRITTKRLTWIKKTHTHTHKGVKNSRNDVVITNDSLKLLKVNPATSYSIFQTTKAFNMNTNTISNI